VRRDVLEQQEPVQPADRDQAARRRRRRERLVGLVALAQVGQEGGDVGLSDRVGSLDAALGQEGEVAAQVTPVGRERVRRGSALDVEVLQPACDRRLEGGGRGRGWCGGRAVAQPSTSARATESIP
jgi:hypothetical protein